MARIKYYYDTETCRYERIKSRTSDLVLYGLGILCLSTFMGLGIAYAYNNLFPSEQVVRLNRENKQLVTKYELLNKEMAQAGDMLQVLQERDDKLYRAIFEVDPVPVEVRKSGTGGTEKFKAILEERLENQELVVSSFEKIQKLKKQMYVQTKSYDELLELARKKSELLNAMPAIQPLSKKDMTSFASGYGMRMHPILKTYKMHAGVDLTAATGTKVYATGNGKVIRAEWSGGYGNMIEIDHGFGYVTRYGHLSAIKVKVGQKVTRGMFIGKVGSTGLSVSPHLHYEVHHNGNTTNPVHYFFNDLTPEEYEAVLKVAAEDRQSLGGHYEEYGGCAGHSHE